jgi:hypothetical protein
VQLLHACALHAQGVCGLVGALLSWAWWMASLTCTAWPGASSAKRCVAGGQGAPQAGSGGCLSPLTIALSVPDTGSTCCHPVLQLLLLMLHSWWCPAQVLA